MSKIKKSFLVASYNFHKWKYNPRIIVTFALCFILCFLLSDKTVQFSNEYNSVTQILEPFIWTFGDSKSILIASMLLMLLFADMPFISSGTPFYLMRTDRKAWLLGQAIYIVISTFIYLIFILISTSLVCMQNSFIGNMWSETAAMLSYSGTGQKIALPAFVKTLEMSNPYEVTGTIFLLMLLYALLMAFVMLMVNIKFGQMPGVVSGFLFSLIGLLLEPKMLTEVFMIPYELVYKANVAIGWMSPLNHATYHMHNFGYDLLPTLWQTFLIFGLAIIACFIFALLAIKKFSFNFTGTEG